MQRNMPHCQATHSGGCTGPLSCAGGGAVTHAPLTHASPSAQLWQGSPPIPHVVVAAPKAQKSFVVIQHPPHDSGLHRGGVLLSTSAVTMESEVAIASGLVPMASVDGFVGSSAPSIIEALASCASYASLSASATVDA